LENKYLIIKDIHPHALFYSKASMNVIVLGKTCYCFCCIGWGKTIVESCIFIALISVLWSSLTIGG